MSQKAAITRGLFKLKLGGSYWARTSDLTNVNRTL